MLFRDVLLLSKEIFSEDWRIHRWYIFTDVDMYKTINRKRYVGEI